VRARLWTGLLIGILAIAAGMTAVGAQSSVPLSSPAPPSSPTGSPAVADCSAAVGMLPQTVDDQPLDATITEGVAAIDPDELLDPLLASLGRTRADVCVVAFRYGDAPDAPAGQLLRIAGAAVTDLAQRFLDALRERLVAYGAQADRASVEAGGRTVQALDVSAEGDRSQVAVAQLGDVLLLTTGVDALDRLLPLLAAAPGSSPIEAGPTSSSAVPAPSMAPASPAG